MIQSFNQLQIRTPTLIAFTGVTNAHGPSPSQQHAGLQRAV